MQTEWRSSEDESVEQILRALSELGARELLVAYEADIQDPTAFQIYRMDCLHIPPLRKLWRYVRRLYHFQKFPSTSGGRTREGDKPSPTKTHSGPPPRQHQKTRPQTNTPRIRLFYMRTHTHTVMTHRNQNLHKPWW